MNPVDVNTSNKDAAALLVEGIEKSWRDYRKELKRCRKEFSIEAVHDVRVAARRLMAIIQLLYSMAPGPRLKKITKALKEQLDEFDDLRDTQVIMAEIAETIQELPELHLFQEWQQRREDTLFRTVRKQLKKFGIRELAKRIRKTQASMARNTGEDLHAGMLQTVDDAYRVTQERFHSVDLTRPVTIHRLRIAFKRFRYMAEIVHPLLQGFPETNLQTMHDYQSLMGDVQDAEVFLQTLKEFPEQASISDSETIHRFYERRRSEAIEAYASAMSQLHTFWRSAPDQSFPWVTVS